MCNHHAPMPVSMQPETHSGDRENTSPRGCMSRNSINGLTGGYGREMLRAEREKLRKRPGRSIRLSKTATGSLPSLRDDEMANIESQAYSSFFRIACRSEC